MADDDYGFGGGFGSSYGPGDNTAVLGPAGNFGGGGASAEPADTGISAPTPSAPPASPSGFGSGFSLGPHYTPPDPNASPLDQTADTLQQRISRANQIGSNPILQFFNPEGAAAARNFVPAATEQLQKIRQQQAGIQAGRQQAETLGLSPNEAPDNATQEQRVEIAKQRALQGDLRVFKGLQAVDPKAAESIQDQVHEVAAGHISNAQLAFDSLSAVPNQGQYTAKLRQLRKDGTLTDLEALGLKVPDSIDQFNASKAREGQALREARIGVDTIRQKLEDRNTYQPMGKDEAATYNGRLKTSSGDEMQVNWSRNASSGARGGVVNGAADPRALGETYVLGSAEQRKSIQEQRDAAVPKDELEKYRAFNRTGFLATHDDKGDFIPADGSKKGPDGKPLYLNTNPNVQQGIAEGLASMLRGGQGGANIGLLKIETSKRGFIQGLIDKINTEKAGVIDELKGKDVVPYLSGLTQQQVRTVMDTLKQYNDKSVGDRLTPVAERAGQLFGHQAESMLGLGSKDEAGGVADAVERGKQDTVTRLAPFHQAIGGGDGVFQIGAQRPGAGATGLPPGTQPTTQQPGAMPLATPVQQAAAPPQGRPQPGTGGGSPPGATTPTATPGGGTPSGGGGPLTIAGQRISLPASPTGASPGYLGMLQRVESGNEKTPWTAGTPKSSASGAFQFIDSTWKENRPPGAPDRAKDATPQQQAEAAVTLTNKNAAKLQGAGLSVNDTSLYMAHNVGAGPAAALLKADPNADARSIVGEAAARNNPLFYRGRPTVATVLARYGQQTGAAAVPGEPPEPGPKNPPSTGGATAEPPGLLQRIGRALAAGDVPGGRATTQAARQDVAENGPAIGSTIGAIGGTAVAPGVGTVAGGAAGGAAGQALKDYLSGAPVNPGEIAKQGALGGVLGVAPEGRPLVGAAARVLGAGAVEGGAEAAKGGDAVDVGSAAAGGIAGAGLGEGFGRALGMVGHKLWSMFGPDAQKAVQAAAKQYSEATATLETEQPKLPGANGAASSPNPKYDAAEKAKDEAEKTLVDAGLKPEEAAYAHKVSSEGVPKQEAEVSRPGALEKQNVGAGYQQLESEVGAAGVGAPKANVKQTNFPINETPREAVMRTGYDNIVRVDANKLQDAATKASTGGLNVQPAKLEAVRKAGSGDGYPRVDVTKGRVSIEDGVHRTTVAAERGQTIDVAVKSPQEAAWLQKNAAPLTKLPDGPVAAINSGKVSAQHAELADRTEAAITAPAASWQEKWTQLKDARSALLGAERDALTSTESGRTQKAKDMRTLADTVRAQQEKVANYVFGPKDGPAFMERLKVLDVRYRNLMEATNGGDLAAAAKMTGEKGREIDRKFKAFAMGDPAALAAWNAMRQSGSNVEKDVRQLVAAEKIPVLGHIISFSKLALGYREWMRERVAGNPAQFADFVPELKQRATTSARAARDLGGTIGARMGVQGQGATP